tara:strand:- start:1924 stop:2121 length:198 start_codon:yes stop_codon:yes gene_type:complete
MNNLINPLSLGKVLKKYNLTPQNKHQLVLLSKRKTATWSVIHRLARKLDFKQSVVDQQENQLQQK